MDGEVLVEDEQLAQGADLSLTVERGVQKLGEGLVFDTVDLVFYAEDLPIEGGRHSTGEIGAVRVRWQMRKLPALSGIRIVLGCRRLIAGTYLTTATEGERRQNYAGKEECVPRWSGDK